jgi:hypothetical protein
MRKFKVFLILLMEASFCNIKNKYWQLNLHLRQCGCTCTLRLTVTSNGLTIVCLGEMKSRTGQLLFCCLFIFKGWLVYVYTHS